MTTTTVVKRQTKTYGPRVYTQDGQTYKLTATVRYDDECNNGHNSFAITGAQYRKNGNGSWSEDSFGCLHDDIAKHFPELAPLLKWHLTSSDGPMYYIENTVYHADEHGPTMAYVYFDDPAHGITKQCMKYCTLEEAQEMCLIPSNTFNYVSGAGYRLERDEKTTKTRNLAHARSCAVWPDATDEELTAPGLKERLEARLPQLLAEFRQAVESLGFTY